MPKTIDLESLADRIRSGGRLSGADLDAVVSSTDLLSLGMLADEARQRRHGDRVTFVRVQEVSVAGPPPSAGSLPTAAGEVRIVGRPTDVGVAETCVRAVAAASGSAPVTGFSLADLEALHDARPTALEEALGRLKEAGLRLVAEAPLDRLQQPEQALAAAGRAGLGPARVTIHRATGEAVVALLLRARAIQDSVGSLRAVAPLAREANPLQPSTGYDDVRLVALARLLIDNIASIQVDWALHGPKLAQVALTFGADDVDAVSAVDSLELGGRRAPLEEIRLNIRAASLTPCERDGCFEIVLR